MSEQPTSMTWRDDAIKQAADAIREITGNRNDWTTVELGHISVDAAARTLHQRRDEIAEAIDNAYFENFRDAAWPDRAADAVLALLGKQEASE